MVVLEGSIRSSKTVVACAAFALYCIRSPERYFLLAGRTVKTIEKNCILEQFGLLALIPGAQYRKVGESRAVIFTVNNNGERITKVISVFGAADSRAWQAIHGNTYGGILLDEANCLDHDFFVESLARTVVSTDRRHYITLNPADPRHWLYTEYLDRYEAMTPDQKRELGGYVRFLFTPKDNPAMTEAMYKALCEQYPRGSYLYARYIEGRRIGADGLVYPNVTDDLFIRLDSTELAKIDVRFCGLDYGANHATAGIWAGWAPGPDGKPDRKKWVIVAELYDQREGRTVSDALRGYEEVCKTLHVDPHKLQIAIDPAALVLRNEFIRHGYAPQKAKNDVLPGLEFVRAMIQRKQLGISSECRNLRDELASYHWDPKATERGEDKPIKSHDDAADALRYVLYTFARLYL